MSDRHKGQIDDADDSKRFKTALERATEPFRMEDISKAKSIERGLRRMFELIRSFKHDKRLKRGFRKLAAKELGHFAEEAIGRYFQMLNLANVGGSRSNQYRMARALCYATKKHLSPRAFATELQNGGVDRMDKDLKYYTDTGEFPTERKPQRRRSRRSRHRPRSSRHHGDHKSRKTEKQHSKRREGRG